MNELLGIFQRWAMCGTSPLAGMALCALASVGCTNDSRKTETSSKPADVLPGLSIVDAPEGGLSFYTPIIKDIPAGADQTYCTYTDVTAQEDLFLRTTKGSQSSIGHHAILFYTETPEEPRTELCGGQSMESLRQLLGGSGGEGSAFYEPPENVGMRVPKGAQFVIQTHWINTTTEPLDVQAMMVTVPGSTSPDRIELGTLALVDLTFEVAPMSHAQSYAECVFEQEHRLVMAIGHEHEWGTHVKAELTHSGASPEVLFDRPFSPNDVFDPPVNKYDVDAPLVVGPGDTIRMTCDWENDTSDPLTFPREMCVFFGYSMTAGDARCINGTWIGADGTSGGTVIEGPPCAQTGAAGNDQGVGKYCTTGGGECSANGSATICLADYTQGEFGDFCTKLCSDDSVCGAGASCVGSGATKTCIPTECITATGADGGADAATATP